VSAPPCPVVSFSDRDRTAGSPTRRVDELLRWLVVPIAAYDGFKDVDREGEIEMGTGWLS
jgi:hypothetical protein